MTIYYLGPEETYIDRVAEFIATNYSSSFCDLKVIVPNTLTCSELQKSLLERVGGASFLPNIMPINFLAEESDISYKIPTEYIDVSSNLEQKLLLMDIIEKHHSSKFSIIQIGHLSDQLLKLFTEFTSIDFDINSLPGVVDIDSASHWLLTTNFIIESYDLWKNAISENGKIDPLTHQKIVLGLESAEEDLKTTIVVGVTYGSKASNDFIKRMAGTGKNVVILPPLDISSGKWQSEIEPYYRIKKLLDYCECDINNLAKLPGDIAPRSEYAKYHEKAIEYVVADNIFQEAEMVALMAMEHSVDEKVCVVTSSRDLVNLCEIALNKYGMELQNLNGKSLIFTKHAEFFLLVALVAASGEIEKIISLLKTPFLVSEEIWKFEMKMLRRPSLSTIDDLIEVVEEEGEAEDIELLKSFWEKMRGFYDKANEGGMVKLSDLTQKHIEAINLLVPNFRASDEGKAIFDFLSELAKYSEIIDYISPEHYHDLIRHLLVRAKYFPKCQSNIIAASAADASILKIDRVIIADCTEGSMPSTNFQDPWMSNKMRIAAGLESLEDIIGLQHYHFSLLMRKPKVFITRTRSTEKTESRFLMNFFKENKDQNFTQSYDWQSAAASIFSRLDDLTHIKDFAVGRASGSMFPSSISATNIELLVRNPYGFYAKKILGLEEADEINQEVTLADFGTLLHNIIALYTESYKKDDNDKLGRIIEIGREVFDNFYDHRKSRAWWRKFSEVAVKFIEWDEHRRKDLVHVYSEIYGEMFLDICGRRLKVTAIADRIELTSTGVVNIIDYKTGAIPTKHDVMRGLSPQLLVEAMIAGCGGFKALGKARSCNLIYIKLGNVADLASKEVSIGLSNEELDAHKIAMQDLLASYISSAVFPVNSQEKYRPKYDAYDHLARL